MADYRYKDGTALAFDANKKRLRAEGTIILDAVMNEALNEMTKQFNEALNQGKVLEIESGREAIRQLLYDAAQKQLKS